MDKGLKFKHHKVSEFYEKLTLFEKKAYLPANVLKNLQVFFESYKDVVEKNKNDIESVVWIFLDFLDLIKSQLHNPYVFEAFHQMIRKPYDYHHFGTSFLKPLVDFENSYILGLDNLKKIRELLNKKESVVLFANHQIEADPQALYIMLEKHNMQDLSEKLIMVAGERVITDPVAVPFSLGCNLLCIYSKRYIDHPPEKKNEKQLHNSKTMKLMGKILSEGGHCIYVAPSGGRDRPDENGVVKPALFDPQSIEMFYLMARHSHQKTHFFPLALSTYTILPPPENVQKELGEHRITRGGAIRLSFGDEILNESLPSLKDDDKRLQRKAKSDYIYNLVYNDYNKLV